MAFIGGIMIALTYKNMMMSKQHVCYIMSGSLLNLIAGIIVFVFVPGCDIEVNINYSFISLCLFYLKITVNLITAFSAYCSNEES